MKDINRRRLLLSSAVLAGAACRSSEAMSPLVPYVLPDGARIVFQGDSITDVDHWPGTIDPNNARGMGDGYPFMIAHHLLFTRPRQNLLLFNRARGGDTVPLLQSRWQSDVINMRPDLLSIMIGINDFFADAGSANYATKYESGYKALIDQTREALTNTQIVIVEPYLIDDELEADFKSIRDASVRVAAYAEAIYVPTHDMLKRLVQQNGHNYWLDDQHPTIPGSAAIAEQWLKTVGL